MEKKKKETDLAQKIDAGKGNTQKNDTGKGNIQETEEAEEKKKEKKNKSNENRQRWLLLLGISGRGGTCY